MRTIVLTSKGHDFVRLERKYNFGFGAELDYWTYSVSTTMCPTNGPFPVIPPVREFRDFNMAYELYEKLVEKLKAYK